MIGIADLVRQSADFLAVSSPAVLLGLFWFPLLVEAPRYLLGFVGTLIYIKASRTTERWQPPPDLGRISILIPGHNEGDSIERGVSSIREQSFTDFEIVCVSDGSTDATFEIMRRLQREGLVDTIAGLQLRGGKSAAANLAARLASGDILIVVDCDCTFERDAVAEILRPFADPTVGVVSGNVLVKNGDASVIAGIQAAEYLVSITLGKSLMGLVDQVSCASGAFSAFRRETWERVGGMDPGPGEDFDITMRARQAGWRVAFAHAAICYTDAPTTFYNLVRQRNRWERDAFWIRFRKFGRTFNPLRADFRLGEALHQIDFVWFNIVAAVFFPVYLVMLVNELGPFALVLLGSISLALVALDVATFLIAVEALGKPRYARLLPYAVLNGPFQSYVMRFVRLYAYGDEWIFSASRKDSYAPPKVNAWLSWK